MVVLTSIQDGAGLSPQDNAAEKGAALVKADADASYEGVLATLRKKADIRIHKDQM